MAPQTWTFPVSFQNKMYVACAIKQGANNDWVPSYPTVIQKDTNSTLDINPLETNPTAPNKLLCFVIGA